MRDTPLVQSHGQRIACDDGVVDLVWVGDVLAIALAGGAVQLVGAGSEMSVAPHRRAILCACVHPDGCSVVTGGDDGFVRRVALDGAVSDLGCFDQKWVHALTSSAESGVLVAAVGRDAMIWPRGSAAPSHTFGFGSTIGGLSLDAKGKRLAVSHYNGATVLYPLVAASGRVRLERGGSHLACTISPDCGYLITALQETGLHGWKLPAKMQLSMSGYPAKTRSFSWSHRGRWLATSGSVNAVIWPFTGKTGPMEKEPLVMGGRADAIVTQVAFHPTGEHLALGHSDGAVSLVRIDDGAAVPIDAPALSITALQWSKDGHKLAYGDEGGRVGILDMTVRA